MSQGIDLKQFVRDSSYNAIRQAASILLGIISSALVARGLGVANRGVYGITLVGTALLVDLLNASTPSAIVYYVARGEEDLEEITRSAWAISAWLSLGALVLGLLIIQFAQALLFPDVPTLDLLVGLLIVPVTVFSENLLAISQGMQNFRVYNLNAIIPRIALIGLVVLFIWVFQWGVAGALLSLILTRLLSVVITLIFLRRHMPFHRMVALFPTTDHRRRITGYVARSYFANISYMLNYRVDVFLLNAFKGAASVGIYDVAVTLGERLWVVSQATGQVLFPRTAAQKGSQESSILTQIIARHIFFVSLILGILTFLLADVIMGILYGPEFAESISALRWLLPGIVMWTLVRIITNDFAGRNRPGLNAVFSVLGVVVNIVANLVLTPRFDFLGTALASTISYSFQAFIFIAAFTYVTRLPWYNTVLVNRYDLGRMGRVGQSLLRRGRKKPAGGSKPSTVQNQETSKEIEPTSLDV